MQLGLLRWLVAASPFSHQHRLGVVWCRVSDGRHEGSSTIGGALDPSSAAGQDLRPLDPDLYDRLRAVTVGGDGSVASLAAMAACGAMPKGTVFYDQGLSFADLAASDQAARVVRRERWFHEAMVAVATCSLVFVDPDDGGRRSMPSSGGVATEAQTSMSEIGRLLERGQSVVVCHRVEGTGPLASQVASRMDDVHSALGVDPLAAVWTAWDTTRAVFVIPHPQHRSDLEDRLGALQLSRWGDELRLARWHRADVLT